MVIGDFSKNVNININMQLLILYCIKLSQKKKMFINIIPPTIAGKVVIIVLNINYYI